MPKLSVIVLYAAILAIIIASLGVYINNAYTGRQLLDYPYGQTDKDKADALRIAFNDTIVNTGVRNAGKYTADVTVGGSFNDSGYINAEGKYALVNIHTDQSYVPQTLSVLADLENNREMEARYAYSVMNFPDFVLVPHGASWYRLVKADPGQDRVQVNMQLEPQYLRIFPIIVDREDFEKFMGGQQFAPLSCVDNPSGVARSYDGSVPVQAMWKTNVTLPDGQDEFYLILENTDPAGDLWARVKFGQPATEPITIIS